MYRFYVETTKGETAEWTNLTKRQAVMMNNLTTSNVDWANIKRFGWELMR